MSEERNGISGEAGIAGRRVFAGLAEFARVACTACVSRIAGMARMARVAGSVALVLLVPAAALAAQGSGGGGVLVFEGRLIDGSGAPAIEEGVVVVEGGRIRCAGQASSCEVPASARSIDVGGGTIMPGLIDLHTHIWDPAMLSMFLPAGVTTVRDLHNSFEVLDLLDGVSAPSPRLFRAGPLIDGPQPRWPGTLSVTSAEEARAMIDSVVDRGVDFVKLYAGLPIDSYRAAASQARDRGARVTTDLLQSQVDALQALEAGVEGFEHGAGFWQAYQRLGGDPAASVLDPVLIDSLARAVVQNDAYIIPTLIVQHQLAAEERPSLEGVPMADRLSEMILGFWQQAEGVPAAAKAYFGAHEKFVTELTRRVAELGGRVGLGSDLPNPYVTPGGALHQEMELLVDAGLTPLQVIHLATGGAAEILRRPDLGLVAPGRVADLVIVAGDPGEDIRATREVRWVVRGGELHSIDALLELAPPVRGK